MQGVDEVGPDEIFDSRCLLDAAKTSRKAFALQREGWFGDMEPRIDDKGEGMSMVVCSECSDYKDSDDGCIVVWEPRQVCETCFERLSPYEAWELCLDAVKSEMGRKPITELESVLKSLASI